MNNLDGLRLNVGCGDQRPDAWFNTDCSLNAALQRLPLVGSFIGKVSGTEYSSNNLRYLNLNQKWYFSDESVSVVYGSHIFEHLSISKADHFLREATRVLKPEGVLRLVVPDLEALARQYLRALDEKSDDASSRFLYFMDLHLENVYPPNKGRFYKSLHWLQGYPHQHKYMYDQYSLRRLLKKHNFHAIETSSYGKSQYIADIAMLEYTAEGVPSVYLEAIKPKSG